MGESREGKVNAVQRCGIREAVLDSEGRCTMRILLSRFTTPEILANETGEDARDIREAIGCENVASIVWVTDSGEARHIPRLSRLFSELLDLVDADLAGEEGDYQSSRYSVLATIDAMEEDGVRKEYTEAFREILASFEGGEA